ncbi:NAD(P)-binding protein [Methylobacterium oryzae CBMB20]
MQIMTESLDFGASPGTDDDVFDAIILGAGITGLVSASILHDLGCRKIAVLDEFGNLGGNHIDRSISGYTFDIGSLIFQDDLAAARSFSRAARTLRPDHADLGETDTPGCRDLLPAVHQGRHHPFRGMGYLQNSVVGGVLTVCSGARSEMRGSLRSTGSEIICSGGRGSRAT